MTQDGLRGLEFKEGGSKDFIKFKGGEDVKLRVFSSNPVVHDNVYEDKNTGEKTVSTKYAFAVWNYDEKRAMILDATASITKNISHLHNDEDYGQDVTLLDLKIVVTGDMLERRYTINVLPAGKIKVSADEWATVEELDGKLDVIIKNGIRADKFNEGERPKQAFVDEPAPEDIDEEPIKLSDIPF